MKARQLQTKIWRDSFYLNLSPDEKLLFVFYFTNEFVNVIHFYECPDQLTAFSTGIAIEKINEAKKSLGDKILFFKDYVLLKNAWRYEKYEGADNENAKVKLLSELADDVRRYYEANYTPLSDPRERDKNKNKNKNPYKNKNNISKKTIIKKDSPFE